MKFPYLLFCKKCKRLLVLADREAYKLENGHIQVDFNIKRDEFFTHIKKCTNEISPKGEPENTIRIDII